MCIRDRVQPVLDTLSRSYRFGVAVGQVILAALDIKPGAIGFDQDSYQPMRGVKYKFDDDPTNPIRIVSRPPVSRLGVPGHESILTHDAGSGRCQ